MEIIKQPFDFYGYIIFMHKSKPENPHITMTLFKLEKLPTFYRSEVNTKFHPEKWTKEQLSIEINSLGAFVTVDDDIKAILIKRQLDNFTPKTTILEVITMLLDKND